MATAPMHIATPTRPRIIDATGNLNAVVDVLVSSQVSGNIKPLCADWNSKAKRASWLLFSTRKSVLDAVPPAEPFTWIPSKLSVLSRSAIEGSTRQKRKVVGTGESHGSYR